MSRSITSSVAGPLSQWLTNSAASFRRPREILLGFRPDQLRADLLAGLTVAVVLLPQAIAYALIAELPPQAGLYAAIVGSIIAALWGSSRHLHTGPTNAGSLLVLATLLPIATPGTPEYWAAAGMIALMVGVIRLGMGLAKLGMLVNFVSDSVIIGFTAGAGILISASQLRSLLRLSVDSHPRFVPTIINLWHHLGDVHWISLGVGLGTILTIVVVRRFWPRAPAPLVGIIAASIAVVALGLEQHGIEVLGRLPRGLPPIARLPIFDTELISHLTTGALAIAVIGLVEATSISRAIASKSGQRLDSNQEFVGQGMANLASSLFSGYCCSGSFTRSAVSFTAGGKSAFTAVFSGFFVLLAMVAFGPLAAHIPRAALAGVLIVIAYNMVDGKEMKRIWAASPGDSAIMVATLAATLFLPLQFAVLSGIIVSIIRFLVKTSMPQVNPVIPDENFRHFVHPGERPTCPQLGLITISGPLYFGAVQHVEDNIRRNLEENPGQRYLLLRMHLVDHCDVSGIRMLEAVVRLYRRRWGDVFIAGLHAPIREQMKTSGFDHFLGSDNLLERSEAVSTLFHKIVEPSICIYECPARVFAECQALPKWNQTAIPGVTQIPDLELRSWLPSEVQERLIETEDQRKFVVIDVREPVEFQRGHIQGSTLLPMRCLSDEGKALPSDVDIVVVCRIGRRSRLGVGMLQAMGFQSVYNLQGGMLAWEAEGFPMSVGLPVDENGRSRWEATGEDDPSGPAG